MRMVGQKERPVGLWKSSRKQSWNVHGVWNWHPCHHVVYFCYRLQQRVVTWTGCVEGYGEAACFPVFSQVMPPTLASLEQSGGNTAVVQVCMHVNELCKADRVLQRADAWYVTRPCAAQNWKCAYALCLEQLLQTPTAMLRAYLAGHAASHTPDKSDRSTGTT